MALGLNYLHQHKYAYRDFKLENILVGRNGIPKLADFTLEKKIVVNLLNSQKHSVERYPISHLKYCHVHLTTHSLLMSGHLESVFIFC